MNEDVLLRTMELKYLHEIEAVADASIEMTALP